MNLNTIESILGKCKFPYKCNCLIKQFFEETNQKQFFIYDNDLKEPVKEVSSDNEFQLTVNNPSEKKVTLVKTDNCLIGDEVSKCDCIIFSEQQLHFVEIKSCSSGTRSVRRTKAVLQLGSTIDYLNSHNIDFLKEETTALICFKSTFPKIIQASRNSARATFREKYGVSLDEGNLLEIN